MYGWLLYFLVVLIASLVVGRHLGRFRESCTEMTGMMAGMTIGMLGGFALGYGMTAASGRDLFVGNLIGVLLGAALGGWFGRAGGLMGIMDGSMGGVMGGSMGAMIAAMVYPDWALNWTGVLFGGIYVVGAAALVALVESRSPEHEAQHWLLPKLALVRRQPRRVQVTSNARSAAPKKASATVAASRPVVAASAPARPATTKVAGIVAVAPMPAPVPSIAPTPPTPRLRDYYAFLGVPRNAGVERIEEAYLDLVAGADADKVNTADRALGILSDPQKRAKYDAALAESIKQQPKPTSTAPTPAEGRGDCCPPPKKKAEASVAAAALTQAPPTHQFAQAAPKPGGTRSFPAVVAAASSAAVQQPPRPQTSASSTTRASTPSPAQAKGTGKPTSNGGGQNSKQKRAQQATQQSGKHGNQAAHAQANRGGKHDRANKQGRRTSYQEPSFGYSFAGRFAMGLGAVLVAGFILVLVGTLVLRNPSSSASAAGFANQSPPGAIYRGGQALPSAAQLDGQATAATVGSDGVQTADLLLDPTSYSYKPPAIKVKKGVPVRLNVSMVGSSRSCTSVVRIPALGAQAVTQPGQAVPMNFTPSQAGVYEFNCPMQMMNPSYLVVTD